MPDLAAQVAASSPGLRRNTGAGLYSQMVVDANRPAANPDATGLFGTVHAMVGGLAQPIGFQVELRQGRLIALHGWSYGQDTRAIDFADTAFDEVFIVDDTGRSILYRPARPAPEPVSPRRRAAVPATPAPTAAPKPASKPAPRPAPKPAETPPPVAVRLRKSLERRIAQGHPWVYRDALEPFHPERMAGRIAANVLPTNNAVMRGAPLFLKNVALRAVYASVGECKGCLNVSNLGRVELPEGRTIRYVYDSADRPVCRLEEDRKHGICRSRVYRYADTCAFAWEELYP